MAPRSGIAHSFNLGKLDLVSAMLHTIPHPSYWHADIGEVWIRIFITRLIPSPGSEIKRPVASSHVVTRRTAVGDFHRHLLIWAKLDNRSCAMQSDSLPLVQLATQENEQRNCTNIVRRQFSAFALKATADKSNSH